MPSGEVMSSVQFDPHLPSECTVHNTEYTVSKHAIEKSKRGSLVDRGANGGILGCDARVILKHQRHVDIRGIDNHEINQCRMVDASAKVDTHRGPVIVIMRQYAYHGINRTIHSAGQIEHYKNTVDDKSMRVGGRQCIKTNDGYILPLDIIGGLPYLKMSPNSDKEYEELPHVVLTSSEDWDPTVLDNIITDKDDWYNTIKDLDDGILVTPFDEFGNYKKREQSTAPTEIEDPTLEINLHNMDFRDIYDRAANLNHTYLCHETDQAFNGENPELEVSQPEVKKAPIDYDKFRPYFLFAPVDKIRQTFKVTTQNAVNVVSGPNIKQTLRSPYPANNVWRRNEPVATDTIFAECPAVDDGSTMAQLFVGRKSLVIDVFGMKSEKEFVNTLEDVIRRRGAMDQLISDSARVETSLRILDIMRALCIDDWQSEPNYQHQNFAEHRWNHLQRHVNFIMNFRNVRPNAWLLCTKWCGDVMNFTAEKSLGGRPPLQFLEGQTLDISILLCFMFWDVVYVSRYDDKDYKGQIGSTKSSEIRGRFVGFAWNVGHALTFKVLTDDTQKVICRSRLRLAVDGENNLKLDAEAGNIPKRVFINSKRNQEDTGSEAFRLPTIDVSTNPFIVQESSEPLSSEIDDQGESKPAELSDLHSADELPENYSPLDDPPLSDLPQVETVPDDEIDDEDQHSHLKFRRKPGDPNPNQDPLVFNDGISGSLRTENPVESGLGPEDMIDRTFLMPPNEDGSRFRAKIIEQVRDLKKDASNHPEMIKFRCRVNDDYEEIVHYNDIVDFIEQDQTWDGIWKFREILDHQGPFRSNSKKYRGSAYNVLVEWETGEKTWEPLKTMYESDPVTIAIYAQKNKLLNKPGWMFPGLKKLAKTQQRIIRRANQAKLHSFRTKPVYQYGFLVPRNHAQAMDIDEKNGNTKWRDAELEEIKCVDNFEVFVDKGKGGSAGPGYKKITVHMVYAVKHDGRHRARLVAGGHLTDTPIDSVYSSVVSLRGVRMLTFLAELNDLQCWSTDISSAYLEAYTKEKVYIIAGPEFGDRQGHTLIIQKALYGLISSGLRWSERFSEVLISMGFFASKAEPQIWMRDMGDHYEYIAVYVDDLLICSKDPQAIVDTLTNDHKFKLKGTGPIDFHLGCDFFRDEDGNLCYAPRKYVEKMMSTYERLFGTKPKQATSPLTKGDHPELDTTALLDDDDAAIYQSLIGAMQWVIQLGRFDIATAVMTLSRFRVAPRYGHLERVKRIYGYLSKMHDAVVTIRTEEPDYSDIPKKEYDWFYSCYRGAKEELPHNLPEPRGKGVTTTSFFDANLMHDLISGRSVTGVLHMFNKTPIDWFSKLQSTVETATFGSEYVAGRICTDQVIDLRLTLRYLGVPVNGSSMVFGDNETMVNTASHPHGKLAKRHNALSFHRTREAIAAGITRLHHISGKLNPADILSKHWDFPSVWGTLKPLLFWRGDTAQCKQPWRKKDD